MRPWFPLAVLAIFVLEIIGLVQVSSMLGGLPTLGLVIATGLSGGFLIRREGRRTWDELRAAVQQNRTPDRNLTDTGLVMIGGMLLLVPGFLTDVIGLVLVLPFGRAPARGLSRRLLRHRMAGLGQAGWMPGTTGPAGSTAGPPTDGGGVVIQGEVVENGTDTDEASTDGGDVERRQ